VFGKDHTRAAVQCLHNYMMNGKAIVASAPGENMFCRKCKGRGHNQRDCTLGHVFRLDADIPLGFAFVAGILKRTAEAAGGGIRVFHGVSPNSSAKPKNFGHVLCDFDDLDRLKNTALVLNQFLMEGRRTGMLSRVIGPLSDGIPGCCQSCGLMDMDAEALPDCPQWKAHRAGDNTCPLTYKARCPPTRLGPVPTSKGPHGTSKKSMAWNRSRAGAPGHWTFPRAQESQSAEPDVSNQKSEGKEPGRANMQF